ncbi:UNVERIFIED_CONTAM: hypothetical protein Slati_0152800 [Sesamum latifolium]|uniref:Integrase catalytic domain-containing protein n=1 Tax=Sesamum latifolium TaxID=2727402 RepID=A0AAW2YB38_9LAMI
MTLKTRPLLIRKGRRLRKKSRKQQKGAKAEELLNIQIIPGDPDKTTRIGSHLGEEAKKEITLCLQRNADIFAWTPQDLRELTSGHYPSSQHRPNCKPYQNPEENGECASILRLEQSMPQRFLSTTTNRSARGFHIRLRIAQHDGCLIRIPSDHASPRGPEEADHVKDLKETFSVLRKYKLKLNPAKCAFGVQGGRFLGFMVTQRGIEANPLKIKAIIDMKAPTCLNEAQRLTGRIAALSRFISKSAKKSLPFFKTLRKQRHLNGEALYLYLSTAPQAVSSVLIREEDGKQLPIYYVSKVLNGAEGRYTPIEKMALALVVTARRLLPYFLSHLIGVKTNTPLKQTLGKPDTSGRLVKWEVELSEYDISYLPKTTIKAQVLADFVSEMMEMTIKEASQDQKWLLHVDGSSTAQGSGAGIVITTPQGEDLEFAIKFGFKASNNEAEYEALVIGLRMAHEAGAKHLLAYSDSQLVVKQVEGTYEAKEERYFWPTMKQDAIRLVSKCERCQKHSSLIHQPAEPLTTMLSPCPFRQWGIDIIGPFPLAAGQRKFLLVAVDYFTKGVEAEPLARITEGEVMKFIWKNIICRFGIPREIIYDNGRQFQGRKIQEWCQGLRIKQRFTTVAHPQANGQVEVTNRILVQEIKRRLERVGENWAEELTSVLWAYRTTPKGSTEKTFLTSIWH